ncbi:MAG: hypothetical protein A2Y12_14155 [Planctomycetes bacterium GWF2_42_9]|nr:MAG: hypothetical protein A2Y12_14155 [Planctomycetes bacterium GWF2_42_9]
MASWDTAFSNYSDVKIWEQQCVNSLLFWNRKAQLSMLLVEWPLPHDLQVDLTTIKIYGAKEGL